MDAHEVLRAIFAAEAPNAPAENCGDNGDTVTGARKPLITPKIPVTARPDGVSPAPVTPVTGGNAPGDRYSEPYQDVTCPRHHVTVSPAESYRAAPAPAGFTADECDAYEERAAILEYDAGLPRPEAERQAADEVMRRRQGRGYD